MGIIDTLLLLAILIVLLRINGKLQGKDPVDQAILRDRLRRENRIKAGLEQPDAGQTGKDTTL